MKITNHRSNSLISTQRIPVICTKDKLNISVKGSVKGKY